jgi:cytochrome b561
MHSTTPHTSTRRYHPALVTLHWLLALLLAVALTMGTFVLTEIPNDSIDKIGALRGHMIMGIAIGALMLVRLFVRWRTDHPPAASTGNGPLDRLRSLAHIGLYALVFAMAASGAAIALLSGLPAIVFGGAVVPLPETFAAYPPRALHGWIAKALFLVIGVHLIGALYHQFMRKDQLLSRMWFGKNDAP